VEALAGVVNIRSRPTPYMLTAPVEQDDSFVLKGVPMTDLALKFWRDDTGQDIAEYAVMLAVILVLVVGTIRLVGSNANNAFSAVASSIQ
jgi:Flp pilus assembly pilin Flp